MFARSSVLLANSPDFGVPEHDAVRCATCKCNYNPPNAECGRVFAAWFQLLRVCHPHKNVRVLVNKEATRVWTTIRPPPPSGAAHANSKRYLRTAAESKRQLPSIDCRGVCVFILLVYTSFLLHNPRFARKHMQIMQYFLEPADFLVPLVGVVDRVGFWTTAINIAKIKCLDTS